MAACKLIKITHLPGDDFPVRLFKQVIQIGFLRIGKLGGDPRLLPKAYLDFGRNLLLCILRCQRSVPYLTLSSLSQLIMRATPCSRRTTYEAHISAPKQRNGRASAVSVAA